MVQPAPPPAAPRPASPLGAGLLLGLVGSGVTPSLTPKLHEAEAKALGLACVYRPLDTDRLSLGADALPRLLDAAQLLGFDGLNVTHPYKQAVLPLLDSVDDEARALGAVNTVVLRGGRRVGHNTDAPGFAAAFRAGLPGAALGRAVLLGAGGAGGAVGHALLTAGVGHLAVADFDPARATALAAALAARFGAGRAEAVHGEAVRGAVAAADGLAHATPTGMAAHPGLPLPAAWLHPGLWVAEIVYSPLRTALLEAARAIGCRVLDGGGMAVGQAVDAFRLFTGLEPDAARMGATFRRLLAAREAAASAPA